MGKHIFVDGSIVATTGILYARNISSGGSWHPDDSEVIYPSDGVWYITEDTGSIFDTYYVSGNVAASGIGRPTKGSINYFTDSYGSTIQAYKDDVGLIQSMLESIPKGTRGTLYLQQQFVSVFSLMEQFLSCTFVRQTCDREDSYFRVLDSGLLKRFSTREANHMLSGPNCLAKELKYIEVANRIIYHNAKNVGSLFKNAFNIDVDLTILEAQLKIRNDIVHRFGHNVHGYSIPISKLDIKDLITIVDGIVQKTIAQVMALPQSERMYP